MITGTSSPHHSYNTLKKIKTEDTQTVPWLCKHVMAIISLTLQVGSSMRYDTRVVYCTCTNMLCSTCTTCIYRLFMWLWCTWLGFVNTILGAINIGSSSVVSKQNESDSMHLATRWFIWPIISYFILQCCLQTNPLSSHGDVAVNTVN